MVPLRGTQSVANNAQPRENTLPKISENTTSREALAGIDALAEVQQETLRRAAESTAKLTQVFVDLLNEQTRQNIKAMMALREAVDWQTVFQIQKELVNANLDRVAELTKRYAKVTQEVTTTAASAVNDQLKRAA